MYRRYTFEMVAFILAIALTFFLMIKSLIPPLWGSIGLIVLFAAALILLRGGLTKIICLLGLIFSVMILLSEMYPLLAITFASIIVFGFIAVIIIGIRLIWILIVSGVAGLGAGFGFEVGQQAARKRFR
jgi:hypothetical protein